MHVADAVAVDKLITALSTQSQLETVEIAFGGAFLSDPDELDVPADMSPDEEADLYDAMEAENDMYRQTSAITAQTFHPAWTSLCTFLENGNTFRLRYATVQHQHTMPALHAMIGSTLT